MTLVEYALVDKLENMRVFRKILALSKHALLSQRLLYEYEFFLMILAFRADFPWLCEAGNP